MSQIPPDQSSIEAINAWAKDNKEWEGKNKGKLFAESRPGYLKVQGSQIEYVQTKDKGFLTKLGLWVQHVLGMSDTSLQRIAQVIADIKTAKKTESSLDVFDSNTLKNLQTFDEKVTKYNTTFRSALGRTVETSEVIEVRNTLNKRGQEPSTVNKFCSLMMAVKSGQIKNNTLKKEIESRAQEVLSGLQGRLTGKALVDFVNSEAVSKKKWTQVDELVSQKKTETSLEKKETQIPISLPKSPSVSSDQNNEIKPAPINPSSQLNVRNLKEMFTQFLATSTKESVADKLIEISNMPFEQQPSMSHDEMNMLCEYLKKRNIVIPEYRIKELQSEKRVNILKFAFVIQNNILPDPMPGSSEWKNSGLARNLDEPLKSILNGLGVKVKYPQKTEEKI